MLISFLFNLRALIWLKIYKNTKVLKKIVKCTASIVLNFFILNEFGIPNNLGPKYIITNNTLIWYILWPMMFLHMLGLIILPSLLYGGYFNWSSVGGSVAKAKLANVSIIKFTHNIWIGVIGDYFSATAPINAKHRATMLTVN